MWLEVHHIRHPFLVQSAYARVGGKHACRGGQRYVYFGADNAAIYNTVYRSGVSDRHFLDHSFPRKPEKCTSLAFHPQMDLEANAPHPGIIISISIITALGIAVLENPQVQQWLDQQRRHLAELLRTLGPDLDPQSRREAEAFAFEGRTPDNDEAIRREAEASRDAAAVATGRSVLSPSNTVRRIPVRGPGDDTAAEERKRLGREYLEKRNKKMLELQEKRRATSNEAEGEDPPLSPTSFDALVDKEGKLRLDEKELPAAPFAAPQQATPEMKLVEEPALIGEASGSSASAWQMGAALANPFGDEFELERSITPKPPVPPKIELEREPEQVGQAVEKQQGSETRQVDTPLADWQAGKAFDPSLGNHALQDYQMQLMLLEQQKRKRLLMARQEQDSRLSLRMPPGASSEVAPNMSSQGSRTGDSSPNTNVMARQEDLSYEEQMAIALSLSESESSKPSATVRQNNLEDSDDDLRAAIEASLRDMDGQQAAHAIAHAAPDTPRLSATQHQPLVDLTPDPPISTPQELPRGEWSSLFDHSVWNEDQRAADPPISVPSQAMAVDEDDLYSATPQLTRARLAVHNSGQGTQQSSSSIKPYDPVHEAASALQQQQPTPLEASFYSAQSHSTSPPVTRTLSDASSPQLIDVSEAAPTVAAEHTPTNRSCASSFIFDNASSEAFESLPAFSREQTPPQQISPAPRSEMSEIEVIDVVEDSDVDMLSEEGDGITTPDSWTEVGSQDGESDIASEDVSRQRH